MTKIASRGSCLKQFFVQIWLMLSEPFPGILFCAESCCALWGSQRWIRKSGWEALGRVELRHSLKYLFGYCSASRVGIGPKEYAPFSFLVKYIQSFSDRSCWELIITTTSHGTSRFVSELVSFLPVSAQVVSGPIFLVTQRVLRVVQGNVFGSVGRNPKTWQMLPVKTDWLSRIGRTDNVSPGKRAYPPGEEIAGKH